MLLSKSQAHCNPVEHLLGQAHIEMQTDAEQGDAARETLRDSVNAHWEVVSCSLAKWAMAELIALSSESDSDEEMDTLMLLYLTSKQQKSVWKSGYMKKRKTRWWIRFDVGILW